ncbi:prepilin-type N-terminal cleavage/methylation domain-containing protein [Stagnimonas aquatica]|uniref:Type II secretion system protein H n=1 Tax=Stagnimonas aquatica TaxID=2689987 RepID=A0A3N0V9K4_9GAMM|nr:prepilin-type N-terminal cleavage/methylation domain-containing protein [Stagnimonas aquatica]
MLGNWMPVASGWLGHSHKTCRQGGFTLLELLVTVAVAGVLLGLAIPAFDQVARRNQLAVTSNQILLAAGTARQLAVSGNRAIAFCAGRSEVGCHGDWSLQEWLVFEDQDRDGVFDSGERLHLESRSNSSSYLTVAANGPFRNRVVFTPTGRAETATGAFAAGRVRVCVERMPADNTIDLVLIGSGRIVTEHHDHAGRCLAP